MVSSKLICFVHFLESSMGANGATMTQPSFQHRPLIGSTMVCEWWWFFGGLGFRGVVSSKSGWSFWRLRVHMEQMRLNGTQKMIR